jgi:hypothetical protein
MVSTQLRVNGLVFTQVGLRPNDTFRNEFDIVIQDPRLGAFALSEAFVLEIAECHEAFVGWREVSFLELKRLVVNSIGTTGVKYPREGMSMQNAAAEVAEESRPEIGLEPFPRIPVEGDNSHLVRAEDACRQKGIGFRLVGGQGSGSRHWGHATYVVSDLLEARKCLHRAEFLPAPTSKYFFIDPCNGWGVRLLPIASADPSPALPVRCTRRTKL